MWRLVPQSWFNRRNPAERVLADAVDLLHEHWRSRLVDGLRRTIGEELLPNDAVTRLPDLSGTELLALDPKLRIRQWSHWHDPTPARRVPLTEISSDREEAAAYLFVAACDASGFVRQRALEAFHHYPGRLAVSAALIRCDDWVSEVRIAAKKLLDAVVDAKPALLVENLDLVVRLRVRQRFGDMPWYAAILSLLVSPDVRGQFWRWALGGAWDVRKFALELIASTGADSLDAAISHALRDADFRVALWGLAQLKAAPGLARQEFLRELAQHPASSVRAAAVRMALEVDSDLGLSLVNLGLADMATEPRTAAAYILEHRFGQSPLPIWRAVLPGPESPRRRAALLGLCDYAAPEDASPIAAEARHRSARIRAAALRGLWRALSTELAVYLERALSDPAKMVVARALELYARSNETLRSDTLAPMFASAGDSRLRTLLRGTRLMDKWQGLRLLLRLAGSKEPRRKSIVNAEIRHWILACSRRFTTPPAEMAEEILGLLEVLRADDSEHSELWRTLADILRRA